MNNLEATKLLTKIISPVDKDTQKIASQIKKFNDSNWEQLIEVANRNTLIPVLYKSLIRKDLIKLIQDEQLLGYLEAFYKMNEERNIGIVKQLQEITTIFEEIGIKPILLKGAAALSESHYESIGERVMIDVDIAVDYERVMEAVDALKQSGYKETDPTSHLEVKWHHYRRLYRDDIPAAVEIHRTFLNARANHYLPKEDKTHFLQSSYFKNALVFSPSYDLYYSFLHTQMSHRYHTYEHLSIRHLEHFCLIATKYNVDLNAITKIAKEKDLVDIWQAYLLVQKEFFNLEVDKTIVTNQSAKNYLQQVETKLLKNNSSWLKVKAFSKKTLLALGYTNLRKYYQFENKLLLVYYIPLRVVTLIYSYSISSKKRGKLYDDIDNLSS